MGRKDEKIDLPTQIAMGNHIVLLKGSGKHADLYL